MTVSAGNTPRPSGTMDAPRHTISGVGIFSIDRSRKRIVPRLGLSRPMIVRKVVVLPAPLEPINVTNSPASTVKSTS